MHMDSISDLIQRLRVHGLSQTEIARRTGISQPKISRWAGGAVPRSAVEALKLASLVRSFERKAKP